MTVRLVNCSAASLIAALPDGCVDLVLLDAPWKYGGAGRPGHGRADGHYDGMPACDIVREWEDAGADVCKPSAFSVVWLTWPLMDDFWNWARTQSVWEYVSGGSWHKQRATPGIGTHFEGDSEPFLLWRKGKPTTLHRHSNAVDAKPGEHSTKPLEVVRRHVRAWCPPGGLVLDPYAGSQAVFAKACLMEGRRYLGAEIDPERFARALKVLDHAKSIHR